MSDNIALIPTPTISYISPANTGSLAFTPIAGASGAARLTVTVTDAGADNDFNTPNDNKSTIRFLNVTVQTTGALSWQNQAMPTDVNDDGVVSPLDALIIINDLILNGSHLMVPAQPTTTPEFFYDVNNDGSTSPLDALIVINWLMAPEGEGEGEGEASLDIPRGNVNTIPTTMILAADEVRILGNSDKRLSQFYDSKRIEVTAEPAEPIDNNPPATNFLAPVHSSDPTSDESFNLIDDELLDLLSLDLASD